MKLKATVHMVLVISPSTSLRVVSLTGESSALNSLLMRGKIKFGSTHIPIIFCRSGKCETFFSQINIDFCPVIPLHCCCGINKLLKDRLIIDQIYTGVILEEKRKNNILKITIGRSLIYVDKILFFH